jgi:uncharacterized phage protein (TIGR01671 family)
MRKTLFRGKEIKTGKWVYGGFHEHKPFIVAIGKQPETEALIIDDGDADWDLPVPIKAHVVEKKTIGEFTGLTDRNDVKIFEGDIVKTKFFGKESKNAHHANFNDYDYFEVRYSAPCFFLSNNTRGFALGYMMYKEAKCEILGNVHDTPELLGGGVTL